MATDEKPQQKPAVKFGQGGVRQETIESVAKKKAQIEKERSSNFFREMMLFIGLSLVGLCPIVLAFLIKEEEKSYMFFKIGIVTFLGLYPGYLVIRFFIKLLGFRKDVPF